MSKTKLLITVVAAALGLGSQIGFSQTPTDPHHPPQAGTATAEPGPPSAAGPQMMDMMANMMKMMRADQMGLSGMNMPNGGMVDHIEGRIAFLKAELKITESQTKLWLAFADALRGNAKRFQEGAGQMMSGSDSPALLARLDTQEKLLTARIEGLKAMKNALAPLYAALSEEQRKSADALLAPQMGLAGQGKMQGGAMSMQGMAQ